MRLSVGKCWGLLIFDLFALAIAGYGYLLGYQLVQMLPHADAFIILMGLFVGIKLVLLSLYDLNRSLFLKNIPFFGGVIATIGNVIIFGLGLFLIPEVPFYFFMGLALVDFLMITISHLLWWLLIGKDSTVEKKPEAVVKETKPKKAVKKPKAEKNKNWLSSTDDESDYDSIFDDLIENNRPSPVGKTEVVRPSSSKMAMKHNYFEEEKRYETGEFLKDIKKNLGKETKNRQKQGEARLSFEPVVAFENKEPEVQVPTEPKETVAFSSEAIKAKMEEKTPAEIVESIWEMPKMQENTSTRPIITQTVTAEIPKMAVKQEVASIESVSEKKEIPRQKSTEEKFRFKEGVDFNSDDQGDFSSIEKRLGLLFDEIEQSMEETHYLQSAVSAFHNEVENYQPIAGDEKIIAAGNLIREKLKAIIDKQFVVDEVLNDLINLSKIINKRIDDLDMIEAGLNQRKKNLDQKEIMMLEKKSQIIDDTVGIRPEELIMENQDSEYIVAEEDYETIQRYLKRVK